MGSREERKLFAVSAILAELNSMENRLEFRGESLSWSVENGAIEVSLDRSPCNEIGRAALADLEQLVEVLPELSKNARALILHSRQPAGFSAGADLRELYQTIQGMPVAERVAGVRQFVRRIHHVFNQIDAAPLTVIAAVHGITFGGGLELALTADLIIADRTARFCFPELRLGLIPGFGGIPRLKRDLGNALVRDLLLTGRSINSTKAQAAGLVSQVTAEGEALGVARSTAAQLLKFDVHTALEAKRFIKPIPHAELLEEIEIFCELFSRPAVEEGLRKFVESPGALPYLP
jgi:enoyl-CoA hydratase